MNWHIANVAAPRNSLEVADETWRSHYAVGNREQVTYSDSLKCIFIFLRGTGDPLVISVFCQFGVECLSSSSSRNIEFLEGICYLN